jgi:hypothetical protein
MQLFTRLLISILLCIVVACQPANNQQTTIPSPTDTLAATQGNDDVVLAYENFLQTLSITEYSSVGKAAQQLSNLPNNTPALKFDVAYSRFLAFRDTAIIKIRLKELEDTEFSPKSKRPADQKLITDLNANFLAVDYSEGMAFLIPNLTADIQKWGSRMTSVMQSYITQSGKELGEGYYLDDGALTISAADVLQRALWWEKFNTQNNAFMFAKPAKNKEIDYLLTAMVGANNTPAFDYETHKLNPEYKKAYELFTQTFGDSQIAKTIKNYYEVLQKTGFKESAESQKIFKDVVAKLQQ